MAFRSTHSHKHTHSTTHSHSYACTHMYTRKEERQEKEVLRSYKTEIAQAGQVYDASDCDQLRLLLCR